jgi:lipoprotein-anchoring transpeptidase ErfK/SrfK
MVRQLQSFYSRRKGKNRMRIGVISGIVIITVFIGFKYGGRLLGGNEEQPAAASADIKVEYQTKTEAVVVPRPAPRAAPEPKLSKVIPETMSRPNSKVTELINEAASLVNVKPAKIIEARDRLNNALSLPMNNAQRAVIKEKLSKLSGEWLFSRSIFPQDRLCSRYKVEPGNLLSSIGKEYKVPWEALMEVNRISRPELLKAGETIKIIHGPFHAKVYRSTFTMDLYLQETFVRRFRVGLGMPGRETPTGLWRVKPGGKMISPKWTDPDTHKTYTAKDPDYPLGSRWIALEGISGDAKDRRGFAIHGTKKPEEIGTAGSRGCIRLYNGDAILVYKLLTPGLSRVEVVD